MKKQEVPRADEYFGVGFKKQFVLGQLLEVTSVFDELWRFQPNDLGGVRADCNLCVEWGVTR